ncbi:MAG: GspE/PulE family protein [Planctomycetes bacterium]|nr:GspE/PulE family protein [Planctomycetota bacterium]
MARPRLIDRLRAFLKQDAPLEVPADFPEGRASLLETFRSRGVLNAADLQRFVSEDTGLPMQAALPEQFAPPGELTQEFLREHGAVPLDPQGVAFGLAYPYQVQLSDDIAFRFGSNFDRTVINADALAEAYGSDSDQSKTIVESLLEQAPSEDEEVQVLQPYDVLESGPDNADDAPVIRLLNHIIVQACRNSASDIHIEAEEAVTRIRFRVDGVLKEVLRPPKHFHNAIVSRIKILSELDIAEKRMPQDGRMKLRLGTGRIDVRVSTIPSVFGEKVVMRILNEAALPALDQLGLSPEQEQRFRAVLTRPYGIILVTGPTGSGKTTTLYSALRFLNSKAKNIITIEDPVEYQMENINQIQVNRRAGIDFASGLKSILRQDPDIIMIGEMRDEETASIAVKAALTGHLVLSTLHTNDAPSSYARLRDMKIAPYLLASSIAAVIAQRLVRLVCTHCKAPDTPDEDALRLVGIAPGTPGAYSRGKGCAHCDQTGYRGRTGIYEILTPTREAKRMILADTMDEGCEIPGFERLVDHGRAKVLAGTTTIEEVCETVRHHEAF